MTFVPARFGRAAAVRDGGVQTRGVPISALSQRGSHYFETDRTSAP